MQIKVKAIEFNPSKLFDPAKFDRAVEAGLDKAAKGVHGEFEKTTATWAHDVVFEIVSKSGHREVSTSNQQYGFVSGGTRAHLIYPGPSGVLRFKGVYGVKTMPRVIGSLSGGPSGGDVFTKQPVSHPGTKPREFDKTIAEEYQPKFTETMTTAVKSGLK